MKQHEDINFTKGIKLFKTFKECVITFLVITFIAIVIRVGYEYYPEYGKIFFGVK